MTKQAEALEFYDRHNVEYVKILHNVFSFLMWLKYSCNVQ